MTNLQVCLALTVLCTTACVSDIVTVSAQPPAHYQRIGPAEGEACGSLLFGAIPIQMASRIERAQAEAMAQRPGATGLINTELSSHWIWWLFGITHCTSVNGVAIREVTMQ